MKPHRTLAALNSLFSDTRDAARLTIKDYNIPCTLELQSMTVLGSGAVILASADSERPGCTGDCGYGLMVKPAAAVKKQKDWTSYYFPVPTQQCMAVPWYFPGCGLSSLHQQCLPRYRLCQQVAARGPFVSLRPADIFTAAVESHRSFYRPRNCRTW